MSDVFILGAGFSRAIGCEMPLLADLGRKVLDREPLPDKKTFLADFDDNIELVMTYLSEAHPWLAESENLRNRALFLDLSVAIREVLLEAMQVTAQQDCPPWLQSLIAHWVQNRSHVITLNYDTLVESVARLYNRLEPDDYYPFPMVPVRYFGDEFDGILPSRNRVFGLYKLHGSINWLYSGSPKFYGETIYYAGLDDVWEPRPFRNFKAADKTPLIVPPVAEKVGYFQHPHVRGTWISAASALHDADRVFCIGYSLPALDLTMRFFLLRNCPDKRVPLFLVDPRDSSEHFKALLPAHTYEVDTKYVGSEHAVPEFVEDLLREDTQRATAGA